MQERYKIMEQIGHGGLGYVFRAFDQSLNREVALKRIKLTGEESQRQEASKQMQQETHTLAALQHPNIVTIYDVGADEEGPFVVMELVKGETLDEIIERAPLTPQDFCELASQIQEGLIAAQDLGLLHRDLKPSNVMVNWLPSGRFQAKIVDFGLAKFSLEPSEQTVDQEEAVYGSIFFMAPEQFERTPLDSRADMYAIGCVYYFALTGRLPFEGETGAQVMASHLEHRVTPLIEFRPDLPRWINDWVMWHINRNPADRPANAREALANFLELTKNPAMSDPSPTTNTPEQPRRPRLIIPGAKQNQAENQQTQAATGPAQPQVARPKLIIPGAQAQQPAADTAQPTPTTPVQAAAAEPAPQEVQAATDQSMPEQAAAPEEVQPAATPSEAIPPAPAAVQAPTQQAPQAEPAAPQPLTPPQDAPPSLHTTSQQTVAAPTSQAPVQAIAAPTQPQLQTHAQLQTQPQIQTQSPLSTQAAGLGTVAAAAPKKKGLSNTAKGALAASLTILALVLIAFMVNLSGKNKRNKRYNALVRIAAVSGVEEVPMDQRDLDIMLNGTRAGSHRGRETVYKALALAKATDGTNINDKILNFTITESLPKDIRYALISRVMRHRATAEDVTPLLDFAAKTKDNKAAAAAIEATIDAATDDNFDSLLAVIKDSSSAEIRKAAESAAAQLIKKSNNKSQYASALSRTMDSTANKDVLHTCIRLLGRTDDPSALSALEKILNGNEKLDKLAAMEALRNWKTDDALPILFAFLDQQEDMQMFGRGFDAIYNFLYGKLDSMEEEEAKEHWNRLAKSTNREAEEIKIVNGLGAKGKSQWAIDLLETLTKEGHADRVIDRSYKAIEVIKERIDFKNR